MRIRTVLFDFGGTLLNYNREETFRAPSKIKRVPAPVDGLVESYQGCRTRMVQGPGEPVPQMTRPWKSSTIWLRHVKISSDDKKLAHYME